MKIKKIGQHSYIVSQWKHGILHEKTIHNVSKEGAIQAFKQAIKEIYNFK